MKKEKMKKEERKKVMNSERKILIHITFLSKFNPCSKHLFIGSNPYKSYKIIIMS